jgi:hypothetical protein
MKSKKESKRLELKRGGSEVRGRGAFSEFHAHFYHHDKIIKKIRKLFLVIKKYMPRI